MKKSIFLVVLIAILLSMNVACDKGDKITQYKMVVDGAAYFESLDCYVNDVLIGSIPGTGSGEGAFYAEEGDIIRVICNYNGPHETSPWYFFVYCYRYKNDETVGTWVEKGYGHSNDPVVDTITITLPH